MSSEESTPSSYVYSINPYNPPEEESEEQRLDTEIEEVTVSYDQHMQSEQIDEPVKAKLKRRILKLVGKLQNAKTVRQLDKFMFVVGLLRLAVDAFLLGRAPCQFYLVYTIVGSFLLSSRFCYYRWKHWHYFMLDFCYIANMLTLAYIWVWPDSVFLYSAVYSYSMGPLLLAIPLFSTGYVPHSLDRMTTVFIHLWPGVTLWTLRYSDCGAWPAASAMPSFYDYSLASISYYSVWFIGYSFIIFYATKERCEKKNNLTLFRYCMEESPNMVYLCGLFGENGRKPMFMVIHICTSCLPLMATYVTLYSYWLQGVLLLLTFMSSLKTSADYFIDIFSRNYDLRMQKLEALSQQLS